jgi:hypothetical protein
VLELTCAADGGSAGYLAVFRSDTNSNREQAVIHLYCIGITLGWSLVLILLWLTDVVQRFRLQAAL